MQVETEEDVRTVLAFVPEAENIVVTSDNRWFVSGNDGLYQIDPNGVTPPQKVPFAFDMNTTPSIDNKCFFLGLTQHDRYVYASATPAPRDKASPRYIMFMDTTKSPASMVAIHKMENTGFFNGMASDSAGNLYLADSGAILPPASGKLVKVRLSSPTTVAEWSTWLPIDGGRPNGIKIDGYVLYFSEDPLLFFVGHSHIKKAPIEADGKAGTPTTIFETGSGKLLDDIELVDGGLVITQTSPTNANNRRVNKVIHISEGGDILHSSRSPLFLPSAVKLFPDTEDSMRSSFDLIVTERGGVVSRLSQDWGLRTRH